MQKIKIHFANFLKYQLYRQAKLYSTFSSTALRISDHHLVKHQKTLRFLYSNNGRADCLAVSFWED